MHSLGSESTVQDRLDYLSMVCANPSDGLSAGLWCETANEGLMLARSLVEQYQALQLVVTRQLTPLDVAATHIDILRRNSESYDAQGRDNVALIVENAVNEARKALFDAISNPASTPDASMEVTDA